MPYTIRRSGCPESKPYGVFKVSDGKRMGCHDTRESAARQIGAIEASESKAMKTISLDPHSVSAIVEKDDDEMRAIPSSVISFGELDEMERAGEMAEYATELVDNFSMMVRNIVVNDGIDREAALNRLVGELLQRMEDVNRLQHSMSPKENLEKAAIKRENGMDFPAGDYAFVPDPSKPSTWKLRLTESPGKVTIEQLGRAAAALSPGGFRGNRAQLPATAVAAIKRRIRAEYRKLGVPSQKIPNSVKGTDSDFMVWKGDDGVYQWFAVYSNNFRDNDNIPEIISEKSHKTFEYLVDEGIVPMPEVWLWHTEGTEWGQADMITYSDGFSIAVGHVYPGKEFVAEALAKASEEGEDIAVSHGMPAKWILRNKEDPTIIDFHITSEISPLPRYAAANKLTGFVVFREQENKDMAIPANKKEWLINSAGLSPEWVERLESGLAKQRNAVTEAGVQSKEADAVAELEAIEESVAEEEAIEEMPQTTPKPVLQEQSPELVAQKPAIQEQSPELAKEKGEEDASKQVTAPVTREEIADVFAAVLKSQEDANNALRKNNAELESRVKELEVSVASLMRTDIEKIAELKDQTPTDSLSSLIRSRIIGDESARVDGRTSLAKDAPIETENKSNSRTFSPLLNRLMSEASQATVD